MSAYEEVLRIHKAAIERERIARLQGGDWKYSHGQGNTNSIVNKLNTDARSRAATNVEISKRLDSLRKASQGQGRDENAAFNQAVGNTEKRDIQTAQRSADQEKWQLLREALRTPMVTKFG